MAFSTTEIVLSNIKDVLGLAGAGLIAVPFFRLERDKRDVAALSKPPTANPLLRKQFEGAASDKHEEMRKPSPPDFRATIWGLALLALSFAISLVLPYLNE